MLDNIHQLALGVCIVFGAITGSYAMRRYWRLCQFPGPFWAKFTDIQRACWVQAGASDRRHRELHEQYGSFVRLGPNMLSLSDPSLISTVYPTRRGIPKSRMYKAFTPYSPQTNSQPLIFNSLDETLHMQMKKPVASLFSPAQVLDAEKHVDDTIEVLFEQLDRRYAEANVSFDLTEWLQYFSFDAMSDITLSRRWGFLEKGCDHNGLLQTMWEFIKTAAPLTQIPWLDTFIYKNRIAAYFRPTGNMALLHHVSQSIRARKDQIAEGEAEADDFLARFLKAQAQDATLPGWLVTAWTFSNLVAGSDSTGSMMKSLWYYLLRHPASMHRLRAELLQGTTEDDDTRTHTTDDKKRYHSPSWAHIARLPYLDACVREAVRLRPPFALPLERVVPPGGLVVGGRFVPGGTVVGMSPSVVNRDRAAFGEDADDWRPERWLDERESRVREMEQSVLTFGAGRRVCLGKNLAMLELKKITAALVLNYQVVASDFSSYGSESRWLLRQWGLHVSIKRWESNS